MFGLPCAASLNIMWVPQDPEVPMGNESLLSDHDHARVIDTAAELAEGCETDPPIIAALSNRNIDGLRVSSRTIA